MIDFLSLAQVLATLTGYILTDQRCQYLRAYLNKHEEYLPVSAAFELSEENVKDILKLPMITSAIEGHENILKFLVEILKKYPNLKEVTLGNDDRNKNALDFAFEYRHEGCVKNLVDFLKEFGNLENFLESLERNRGQFREIQDPEFHENLREFLANNTRM